jgi:hypothetical protein
MAAILAGSQTERSLIALRTLPLRIYLVAFLWPIVTVICSEIVRTRERSEFMYFNRFRRLEFDTKLGQTSPF